jgi:hypothetical protein
MTDIERETPPPPELKGRVVGTLRQRGLLRRAGMIPLLSRMAAAAVLFLGGLAAGRASAPDSITPTIQYQQQYLLTLYEDSTFSPRSPISDLVREYGAWADSLRGLGRLVIGEKLGAGPGTVVSEELEDHPESMGAMGSAEGVFVIAAASEEEALAIARSMPHLRHGGRIVLRRIEAT